MNMHPDDSVLDELMGLNEIKSGQAIAIEPSLADSLSDSDVNQR